MVHVDSKKICQLYLLELFPFTIASWGKITNVNQRAYINCDFIPCLQHNTGAQRLGGDNFQHIYRVYGLCVIYGQLPIYHIYCVESCTEDDKQSILQGSM